MNTIQIWQFFYSIKHIAKYFNNLSRIFSKDQNSKITLEWSKNKIANGQKTKSEITP